MHTYLKICGLGISLLYSSGLMFGASAQTYQTSFDCTKATQPTDKAICGDPELAKLDSDFADAYRKARAGDGRDSAQQYARQLNSKKMKCGSDKACIAASYNEGIAYFLGSKEATSTSTPAAAPPLSTKTTPVPAKPETAATPSSSPEQKNASAGNSDWQKYNLRPKTLLEQVANYTFAANENGLYHTYFVEVRRCVVKRNSTVFTDQILQPEIEFTKFNMTAFRITFGSAMFDPSSFNYATGVEAHPDTSQTRVQKAWGLAFAECPGKKSAF